MDCSLCDSKMDLIMSMYICQSCAKKNSERTKLKHGEHHKFLKEISDRTGLTMPCLHTRWHKGQRGAELERPADKSKNGYKEINS